jgi:hypothetical protein
VHCVPASSACGKSAPMSDRRRHIFEDSAVAAGSTDCSDNISSPAWLHRTAAAAGEEPLEDSCSQLFRRHGERAHLLRQRLQPEAALIAWVAAVARSRRDRGNVRRWNDKGGFVELTIASAGDDDDEQLLVDEERVPADPELHDATRIEAAGVDGQPADRIRLKVVQQ